MAEGSDVRGDKRVWVSSRALDALSASDREKAGLIFEAYRQQVNLWDEPNPVATGAVPYRRLFRQSL